MNRNGQQTNKPKKSGYQLQNATTNIKETYNTPCDFTSRTLFLKGTSLFVSKTSSDMVGTMQMTNLEVAPLSLGPATTIAEHNSWIKTQRAGKDTTNLEAVCTIPDSQQRERIHISQFKCMPLLELQCSCTCAPVGGNVGKCNTESTIPGCSTKTGFLASSKKEPQSTALIAEHWHKCFSRTTKYSALFT
jgi:hypothetical protein